MTQLPKTSCSIPMPEVVAIYNPKVIARIKLCGGAVTINVDDTMSRLKTYMIYFVLMLRY